MIVLRRRRKEEAILARETPDPLILAGHLAAEGNRRVLDSLEPSLLRPLWVDIQPLPKDGLRVSGESIPVANPSKEKIDGEFRRNRPGVAGEGLRRERCIWQPVRVRPLYGGGHKTEGANDGGLARRVRSINRGDRQHLLLQSRRAEKAVARPGQLAGYERELLFRPKRAKVREPKLEEHVRCIIFAQTHAPAMLHSTYASRSARDAG